MSTYVLVHGAWHGGWCWREIAALLRDLGHTVHIPSLSGNAEHGHQWLRNIIFDLFAHHGV